MTGSPAIMNDSRRQRKYLFKVIIMKPEKGFTIIELLVAVAVIALLLSLLLPSMSRVRNMAREAKQRVQFSAIDQALLAWRNDYGEYPPSSFYDDVAGAYFCGTQKLAEALFGLDLLGFHPGSTFRVEGVDGDEALYQNTQDSISLQVRQSRYLELEAANAYRLGYSEPAVADGLFANTGSFYPASYVLCDEFARIPITVGMENKRAGLPILYYRANTSSNTMIGDEWDRIYNPFDNSEFVNEFFGQVFSDAFTVFVTDPKASSLSGVPWPYKPDSYILISAGLDGRYGTLDDITNFR